MSINGNAGSNILRGRIADPDVIHGLSAYEIDVMHGYDGTEEEWLKYVRGDFDDRVEEAKAEFDNEVDTVIVPEAKAELESAKEAAVTEIGEAKTESLNEIETAETNSLSALSQATESHKNALENAAAVLEEKEVLLWENPDTEDAFSGETIDLSANMSDEIERLRLVFFTRTIGEITLPSVEVERGHSGRISFTEGYTSGSEKHSKTYLRDFLVHANGNVQIEGTDDANAVCIPYRIYGVKNSAINIVDAIETANEAKTIAEEAKNLAEQLGVFSPARIGEVNLTASGWVGETSPYAQVVEIDGVTENSQVDLTPSVEQLAVFYNKDLAFVTENEDGVVTVYAIGQRPQNDYTIQVTITEVNV